MRWTKEKEHVDVVYENWLGNTGKFVIDGINLNGLGEPILNGLEETENFGVEIQLREKAFVKRIQELINPTTNE